MTVTTYNTLTPDANVQSASQFHVVSWAEVLIDSDPSHKEVYRQGASGYGDERVDLFALSNVALSRLMNAAGIEEVRSIRTDNRENPYLCAWQFAARYVQPDSTVLNYSADYELDLRDYINVNGTTLRGARFDKALVDERSALIYQEYKDKDKWGKLWGDNLTKKTDEKYASVTDEEKQKWNDLAEAKALRYIVQMRQFIVQRAQTGAMERAIRKMLNLKSAYTLAELKNPFRVPRSRFDWDRLDAAIGKESGKELRQLEAMKLLGIDVTTYQKFKQLNSPATVLPAENVMSQNADLQSLGTVSSVLQSVPETGENESSGPEDETPTLSGEMTEPVTVEFQGQIVGLDDRIGQRLAKDKTFFAWYQDNLYKKFDNKIHYNNHLEYHFGVKAAPNLTFRQVIAFDNNINKGIEYPVEYHPTEKKEKKASTGTLSKRVEEAGLTSIIAGMGLDTTDSKVIQVIEDMLLAVEKGVYDLKTDEGYLEATTFLEMTLQA